MHTHKCRFCGGDYHCTEEWCLKKSLTCTDCRLARTVQGIVFVILMCLAVYIVWYLVGQFTLSGKFVWGASLIGVSVMVALSALVEKLKNRKEGQENEQTKFSR